MFLGLKDNAHRRRNEIVESSHKLRKNVSILTMANDDDGWVYPQGHTYQPVIAEFMSFLHGAEPYDNDTVFTRTQLLEIRPIDVKRYLCMKAYRDPDPNIDGGARPTKGRSGDSLYYNKKAISKCHIAQQTGSMGKAIQPSLPW